MRREHRGRVLCRKIATFFITLQGAIDEVVEFLLRAVFSGRPDLAEVLRPVRLDGQQLPVIELFRCRPRLRCLQALRRLRRGMRLLTTLQCPPEGRIDPVRPARLRLQPGGLVQQVAGKAADRQAVVAQFLLQRPVGGHASRIVTPVPENGISAGVGYQLQKCLFGLAA
ncbi:hypothetical protein D3C80_1245400 [compost metagenome]